MQVLLIDNYDSFTYNIVQILEESRLCNYKVIKNDELSFEAIENFDKIVISPGPGVSAETKNLKEVIKKYHQTKPVLGICLGHQAIGEFFGAKLIKLDKILHGEESEIQVLQNIDIFNGFPDKIKACRYHSWVLDSKNFPKELEITAIDERGHIMALQHKTLPLFGVQFHPESFMTEKGKEIVEGFLRG